MSGGKIISIKYFFFSLSLFSRYSFKSLYSFDSDRMMSVLIEFSKALRRTLMRPTRGMYNRDSHESKGSRTERFREFRESPCLRVIPPSLCAWRLYLHALESRPRNVSGTISGQIREI